MSTTQMLHTETDDNGFYHTIRTDEGTVGIDEHHYSEPLGTWFRVSCHAREGQETRAYDLAGGNVSIGVGPFTLFVTAEQAAELVGQLTEALAAVEEARV